MSNLGRLNYYFLQWFFIRLARVMKAKEQIGWSVIGFIKPTTGWNEKEYKYVFYKFDKFLCHHKL